MGEPKWWHSTASGVFGGFCCVYAGQPFDTIKVRLQTQSSTGPRVFTGPLDCALKTIRSEGFRALYKGASAALLSIVTENAVLFTANAWIKRTFHVTGFVEEDEELSLPQLAIAGGVAGVFSSTAICPAEIIKCRLQVALSAAGKKVSPFAVAANLLRTDGPLGFFRGLPSLWLRDIPFNFLFLGSYEANCALFAVLGNKTKADLNPAELFISGGCAGMVGWACVFPMDVVKSRMQTNVRPPLMSVLVPHGCSCLRLRSGQWRECHRGTSDARTVPQRRRARLLSRLQCRHHARVPCECRLARRL